MFFEEKKRWNRPLEMSATFVGGPERNTRQCRVVVTSTGGRGEVQFATERVATPVFVREGRYSTSHEQKHCNSGAHRHCARACTGVRKVATVSEATKLCVFLVAALTAGGQEKLSRARDTFKKPAKMRNR